MMDISIIEDLLLRKNKNHDKVLFAEYIEITKTEDLTAESFSKKHECILSALFQTYISEEEKIREVSLSDLHRSVELISYKKRPLLDTYSFIEDLANRGYVSSPKNRMYIITKKGRDFLRDPPKEPCNNRFEKSIFKRAELVL
jgi:hypothetical protein